MQDRVLCWPGPAPDLPFQGLVGLENAAGALQEHFTGRGQLHAVSFPPEQRRTDFFLDFRICWLSAGWLTKTESAAAERVAFSAMAIKY